MNSRVRATVVLAGVLAVVVSLGASAVGAPSVTARTTVHGAAPEVGNGLIAFEKRGGIFTIEDNGEGLSALTADWARLAGAPAWRQDGARLAVNKVTGINDDSVIVTMNPSGGERRRLPTIPTNAHNNYHPAWAPGGHRIAITRCGGETDCPAGYAITVIRVRDGSPLLALPYDDKIDAAPEWSPDGSAIAFERCCFPGVRRELLTTELFVWRLADNRVIRLTDNRRNDSAPSWSPDGSSMTFQHDGQNSMAFPFGGTSENHGPGSIRVLVLATDEQRVLTQGADDFDPAYSPDGQRIVFGRCPVPGAEDTCDLYSMDTQGADMLRVTHSKGVEINPSWQPVPAY